MIYYMQLLYHLVPFPLNSRECQVRNNTIVNTIDIVKNIIYDSKYCEI